MMIDVGYRAVRARQGWLGQFTYTGKDGVARTELVRDAAGLPRLFNRDEAAEKAAGRAMCRALNGEPPPPVAGKVFTVRHAGGRSHITAAAEAAFRRT